jgi:hypothetical protein
MEYAQAALNLVAKSRFLGNITSDIVWLQQETVTLPDGTQTVALVPISIWFPATATPDKTLRPMFSISSRCFINPSVSTRLLVTSHRWSSRNAISNGSEVSSKPGAIQELALIRLVPSAAPLASQP